jgi:hypothetical protein
VVLNPSGREIAGTRERRLAAGRLQEIGFLHVVQLPERFLRLTQMLPRSPLPEQPFISEQVYEKLGRIIGFLVQ